MEAVRLKGEGFDLEAGNQKRKAPRIGVPAREALIL
jgi:hypothetical protein